MIGNPHNRINSKELEVGAEIIGKVRNVAS